MDVTEILPTTGPVTRGGGVELKIREKKKFSGSPPAGRKFQVTDMPENSL